MSERSAKMDVSLDPLVGRMELERKKRRLTQRGMGALLGMSASRYSEFVAGKRALSFSQTKRAYALGFPAKLLLAPNAQAHRKTGPGESRD